MRPFLRFGECSSKISADSFLLEQISLEVTMDVSFFGMELTTQFSFWDPPVIELSAIYLVRDLIDQDLSSTS